MSQRTIPEFLCQLAGAVDKLVQTSGLEHWRRRVRQWATQEDEREGLQLLDLPMELSLDEKYALLAAVHDARADVEGGTQIDPWPDGYYTTYYLLKLGVAPYPQARVAGLDESQAPRLLGILREVAADLEKSSRLWTPDRTSDAHPSAYRDPVAEYERFLEEQQSRPIERPVSEPAGVQQAAREPQPREATLGEIPEDTGTPAAGGDVTSQDAASGDVAGTLTAEVSAREPMEEEAFRTLHQQPIQSTESSSGLAVNEPVDGFIDFDDLVTWTSEELKGKQRRCIELLVENKGKMPIPDLAADSQISWEAPYNNAFNSIRQVLNTKLKKAGKPFIIRRHDNEARLSRKGQK